MAQRVQDMWRPAYEQWAALGWAVAALVVCVATIPYRPIVALMCALFAAWRGAQAARMYRFRLAISGQRLARVPPEQMLEKTAMALGRQRGLWLGRGFAWTPQHAQLARQFFDRNPEEIPMLPEWLPRIVRKLLLPRDAILDPHVTQGASWLHGLGSERDLFLPLSALPGHTLIVGTTRSGKTRLYELLTFQVIHGDATLLVLDPKGDADWERRLRAECERCGRDFLYFHLAFPSQSIRINPLASWNNPSEIASRISQLLAGEAGGDGFVDFADSTISRIVNGQVMVGERPSLKSIKHYVEHGVGELLGRCFQKWFVPREGPNWDAALAPYIQKAPSRVHAMAAYYAERYVRGTGDSDEAIDGLVTILHYDKDWFSRVIVRLVPLLQRLATGELGGLLSPDVADLDDARPVYTMEKIVSGKKVLYIGADMLSNKLVGSAVLSMLLADLAAVAGAMYNFGGKQDVYLFVDEAAEAVNEQLIQIQNKGGMAGFRVFLATQTCADFEARLGKRAKATQVFGNTNNVIALRLRDHDTAKMISELFGETTLSKMNVSHSSGSHTEALAIEFKGTVSRTLKEERAALVGADVLMRLPNLQYFAMVAGGNIVKGRLPVIT